MRAECGKWPRRALIDALRGFSSLHLPVFLCLLAFCRLHAGSVTTLRIQEKALTFTGSSGTIQNVTVFTKGSRQPLFGALRGGVFVPAVSFVRGQTYEAELQFTDGSRSRMEVTFAPAAVVTPTVRLSPATNRIPANTLKLYLDFSEPMEQGVFLKRLVLLREDGAEVTGAFRETELWSPDGRRLTVMLHPGRQKTGVNLNVDEGPVLIAGESYRLVVAGQWRSTTGAPLGERRVFSFAAEAADHEQPDPEHWQVHPPEAGTQNPLVVITDEVFEPRIFQRALKVADVPGKAAAKVSGQKRIEWRFTPERPWKPGGHAITISAELEDLAGNTTQKLFEVDLAAPSAKPRLNVIRFQISPH